MKRGMSERELKEKALNYSIKEGSAAAIQTGFTSIYITPFALKLNASNFHIGLLSALSGIAAPLSQIFSNGLVYKYSRKKLTTLFVALQAVSWLPLALIAMLAWKGFQFNPLIYYFILAYTLVIIFGGIAHPPWFSWMGDLVEKEKRGRYFAKRNLITGIVELCSLALATLLIRPLENTNFIFAGFTLLFVSAFLARTVSFLLLLKQYSPKSDLRKKKEPSLKEVWRENKNFRIFAKYQFFFNLAIMLASPFFSVYMLTELKFNYFQFMLISISSSVFYLVFSPWAGKFSDKYGNIILMKVANVCFIATPILWLFSKNMIYLIFVPQLVAGIANAALIIYFTNFVYASLPREHLTKGLSTVNLLVGFGTLIGSLSGGLLLNNVEISFINKFLLVFILAALLRFIVALIFIPGLKEEKRIKYIPPVYISLVHPFRNFHHEPMTIKHKIVSLDSESLKVRTAKP